MEGISNIYKYRWANMNFHQAVLADFFFCSKVHFKFLCIVLMSAYILVTFYFF